MSNEVVPKGDERLARFIAAGESSAVVDPVKAQEDIVRRILAGDSIEDVLTQTKAIHAKDVLDIPIRVVGVRRMESDIEGGGPSFYMLVDCVTDEGEPYSITCGAVNVMAQLHRIEELQGFPIVLKLVEVGKPTKAGYKPMWAEGVPGAERTYDPARAEASF